METERMINFMQHRGAQIKQDLERHLKYIEGLDSGKLLLQNINEYFTNGKGKGKKFSIEIINDPTAERTQFDGKDENHLKVIINRSQFKQDDQNNYYIELPEIKAKYRINKRNVFEIGLGKTYEPMILAHELIHLNHYIQADNKTKALERFGTGIEPKTAERLQNRSKYPELIPLRIGRDDIFANKEERKTVWGGGIKAKTDDDISELSLRLEAGLNPRYIYQNPGDAFLESYDNLINSVGLNKNKIELSDFLQQMPYSDISKLKNIKGSREFIRYTPVDILNEIYPKSESGNKQLQKTERLHRLMMAQFAPKGYNANNLNEIPTHLEQNTLLNKTKYFMKTDPDRYKRAIKSVQEQKLDKIKEYIRKKYKTQCESLTDDQILETAKVLLNNHITTDFQRDGLEKFKIDSSKVTKNLYLNKVMNHKINRRIFKDFIYSKI